MSFCCIVCGWLVVYRCCVFFCFFATIHPLTLFYLLHHRTTLSYTQAQGTTTKLTQPCSTISYRDYSPASHGPSILNCPFATTTLMGPCLVCRCGLGDSATDERGVRSDQEEEVESSSTEEETQVISRRGIIIIICSGKQEQQ